MKPRQTLKNYHNPNSTPYRHPKSSVPPTLRDIDLEKLGLGLEDMANLTNQEDIVKCLQSFYGKNSAELLQKPQALNDWPLQSMSPPDYSGLRVGSNVAGSSNSGASDSNVVGGACGLGFNNNVSNNNINSNPGQQKQDLQFTNSQHSHHPSAINHFRISTSSAHSQQQPLPQQKSVLSLHQHHQNDLSNRRLNHHHMSTTNTSFANLSTVNASNATSTSTPTSDTNNLSALGSNITSKNSCPSGVTPHSVSNIMDTLGSMDNMFFDSSLQASKDTPTSQQSLIRHQQLQKLLKATGSQLKPSPSTSSTTTLLHRSDLQPQRNITSNNMPQNQHQILSPAPSITSQQAAFTSVVPKSLLNLAACSSSSPTSTSAPSLPSPSVFSSMVSQLRSARTNSGQANLNSRGINNNNNGSVSSKARVNSNITATATTTTDNSNNDAFTTISSSSVNDHNNMLQQLVRSATASTPSTNIGPPTRSNTKSIQLSLLSDDQSLANRTNSRGSSNAHSGPISKAQSHILTPARTIRDMCNDIMANFQKTCERDVRAGICIGEINKTVQTNSVQNIQDSINNSATNQVPQQGVTVTISPTQSKDEFIKSVDNKEIESALSRVEARNDLSLLYPPMLLATNSQKQINALSAGLHSTDEAELFTREVKRIVLEECNIIYECKECNNLFRSLANLVKHKRIYCLGNASGRSGVEMNKRPFVNTVLPMDPPAIGSPVTLVEDSNQEISQEPSAPTDEIGSLANNYNLRGTDRRQNLANDLRMLRIIRNQERKNNQGRDTTKSRAGQVNGANSGTPATQTSLSKLLQSQPKNRLPTSRDSALIGALNMAPISAANILTNNPLSSFDIDKNINCSSNDVQEQFVRNSTLAKTLLNEKVKSINPRQSSIELSKAESIQQGASKRVAPKRKLLEDCIQKVKRDKLLTDEEEAQVHLTSIASNYNAAIVNATDLEGVDKEQNAGDVCKMDCLGDSDNDSDMLTIDLDGPKKIIPVKKAKRRVSTAESSTASSSSSMRLNTSSALLKALTRPIDTKKPYNTVSLPHEEKLDAQTQDTSSQDNSKEKTSEEVKVNEAEFSSPLFDKYTCDVCETDFDDIATLMNHTLEKHKEEKMLYPCIFCSFSFIALENVCQHIVDIHKKPKAQVHRLKEVVRSRSYVSSDYLACSDYPSKSVGEKDLNLVKTTDEVDDKDLGGELTESSSSSDSGSSSTSSTSSSTTTSNSTSSSPSSSNDSSPSSETDNEQTKRNDVNEESSQELASNSPLAENIVADNELEESSSAEESSAPQEDMNTPSSGKHISPTKDSKSQQFESDHKITPDSSNDSDEEEEDSEEGGEYDSTPPDESDERERTPELARQGAQKPSSHSKSTSESTPSSSSASGGGGGGIMKLKIQLKTRPDEKSKVYEIV